MPEFQQYLQEKLGSADTAKSGEDVLSRLLDKYIDEQIFAVAVQESNMKLEPGELEPVLARLRPPDKGYTPSSTWVEKVKNDVLTDRFIQLHLGKGIEVSDQEVESYYRKHLELFRMPERFRAREIVLNDQSAAEQARRQLLGKSVDVFAAMAVKMSQSPSAAQGGDMGLRRQGQLPPEIEKAILPLRAGEMSGVVKTPYGYHLFLLEARRPEELLTLDVVRDSIHRELGEEKLRRRVEEYLGKRRRELQVRIFERNLGFHYREVEEGTR